MVTPVVAVIESTPARKHRGLRTSRTAVYVPYRRRTKNGAIGVATAIVVERGVR